MAISNIKNNVFYYPKKAIINSTSFYLNSLQILVINAVKPTLAQLYNCMQLGILFPPLILEAKNGSVGSGDKHPSLGQGNSCKDSCQFTL